jgi:flagellar motor switch protein FliN
MSNNDMLSQDDIDNLITNAPAGSPAGAAGGGAVNLEALKKPLSLICEQISTVLLTVLGKEISVSIVKLGPADAGKLNAQFGADSVLIRVDLFQKVTGSLYFAYGKKDVAVLADLMMMGDGSAPYEEDHKDAIVELTNQILGAVTSTFGTTYEAQVNVSTPAIEDFKADAAGLNPSDSVAVDLTMKVEDIREIKFAIIMPNSTASDLVEVAGKSGAQAGTAAPAGGPTASGGEGGDAAGFDFGEAGGAPLQNFSQPSGKLANDKSAQFSSTGNPQMDMLLDVTLQVAIELGRTEMSIKKILELGPGSIIELDRMAGEPVDLLVNDKVVAKGEVVVVDENFGIRIVKLVSSEERLKNLR